MEKKFFAVLTGLVFLAIGTAWAGGGDPEPEGTSSVDVPGKAYFDRQFGLLQGQVAEVKGDTTQIVSILGNVFEGTVPKGGTLTGLCNQNGWNLIVLMGHNKIVDPNKVAAGTCFTYPKTAEEFQLALKKGKPLYDSWLAKQKTTFRVNRVKVDTAEIDTLNIRVANIKEKLAIKDMEVDQLKVRLAEITERLRIKKAEVDELNVKVANFDRMNIDQLRIKDAKIQNLEIEKMRIKDALIDKLRIKNLQIDKLKDLLRQAQLRCQQLEAWPPKIVELVVPVTPGLVQFRQDSNCGDPWWPKSWEWPLIEESQQEGILPVFYHVYHIIDEPWKDFLKVKIDYYDTDTKMCYSVWCFVWHGKTKFFQEVTPEEILEKMRQAGFKVEDGKRIRYGDKYNTEYVGRVTGWPAGAVCLYGKQ